MEVATIAHAKILLLYMQHFVRRFVGFKTMTTVTISNNHQEMKLTDPDVFAPGEMNNPLNPTITPGQTPNSSFTSQGMISYKIIGQTGPNWDPLYLIVTWKVKLIAGENSICINVREYQSPPLENKTSEEKYYLFKELHKKENRIYPGGTAMWEDDGSIFIVKGTIDNMSDATIKVSFDQKN
ncbi:uncharacterized protein OCT59_003743 [Rhizophagus irregularis]|uniref:Uncharacterized protein n=2 Tax=Rhizophagus irregularis TaxID=588596 RepID=A0A915ZLJ2_9GLOM|nr:hypothetical protein GLOIN_2v463607 [Rhizophagus irregularis DAOM 181602=DAOM 197198]UZO12195.1 hypothetical protein OCT59_003743 [Rhizophagus irregularis]POG64724.1 hypothetical protein GLOIN_2v463607 [Rhizophagus irregularis DAOM 181602=DAOM 197198]CAB4483174.1 unnamed protein product [Rhizophagus irregularis]CAB5382348.1 unnamed protein product [Rhizophagus irregularis]GBC17491.1 hypothetical protein GLOIN_2v463607 [Rhizophagus irregularis DAOM 181602=DAOM 197198]|eukprot:XP_025171590.1 hypothetical protein GLOIN_2v463607 [Rhizophagus irregularis DAOM 181602=DAOM 197198]